MINDIVLTFEDVSLARVKAPPIEILSLEKHTSPSRVTPLASAARMVA